MMLQRTSVERLIIKTLISENKLPYNVLVAKVHNVGYLNKVAHPQNNIKPDSSSWSLTEQYL